MNKFYDTWEASKVLEMTDEYPYQAVSKIKDYIEKFPKDYYMKVRLVLLLINIGQLDEAQVKFDELEQVIKSDISYLFLDDVMKKDIFFVNFYKAKMRLLVFKDNDYKQAYEIFNNEWRKFQYDDDYFYSFEITCRKKFGIEKDDPRVNSRYLYKQTADYQESEFLSHIEKHLANRAYHDNANIFGVDFPLEKVFAEIKKIVPTDPRIYYGIHEDWYIFKYDSCGRADNQLVDYFKLVALHDSQEFITMLPITNQQGYPYIDLNYLKEEKKEVYPSRVDRFNRRLAKKRP